MKCLAVNLQLCKHKMNISHTTDSPASLLRRLAAIFYDSLLLLSVLFFATLPLIVLSGEAVHSGQLGFQLYLLAVCFIYFGWQWTHGGQTLGMKAWRLKVINTNDAAGITWRTAAFRFMAAIPSLLAGGLGFVWILFDRQHLAWHDRLSSTRIILLPRPGRG